ncbi:hypothetical protein IQ252_08500 [Tychonema sp. LEGE 07203]|nr:hypothetical protein [Tychonema sp. LEGE 07203]
MSRFNQNWINIVGKGSRWRRAQKIQAGLGVLSRGRTADLKQPDVVQGRSQQFSTATR